MNIRTRFALITSTIVLAIAVAVGLGAYGIASTQLHDQIDKSLQSRAVRLAELLDAPSFRPGEMFGREVRDEILGTELDAITQIDIPGTGPIGRQGNPVIPSTSADVALSTAGIGFRYSSLTANSVNYRILTIATPDGTLVRVGKDTAIVDKSLGAMRTWFPVLALLSAFIAAVIGWLFASRVSRPIETLANTADSIARTQDLDRHIEVSGKDEVAKLATSFNTMLEALRGSLTRQRQLVQDASHELRTPLTSLRANTELLERATLSEADKASILSDMRAEVDELSALSAELSALATDQRSTEELSTTDLAEIAEDIATRASRRTTSVVTVHTTNDTVVSARPQQLERAISNMVDNAVKFSDANSDIEIHVGARRIEVRDHGPGISDADKAHVFDRFYRAASTRSMPGSGLGLAIVAQFAHDHGATVYVLDNPGGGAIVGLQFP
jgi:two-component system, OmpR family, sensor histidine kinase MprB